MNKPIVERIEELRVLNANLRHQLEVAECVIPEINDLIRRLAATGLLKDYALIGGIVYQQPYVPGYGPTDSGQVLVAAIVLPHGVGVVILDSEQFVAANRGSPDVLVAEATIHFVPFEHCEPVTKAMLLSHVAPLLNSFCGLIM